tara:strand:- start:337 stop:555 length:219 start_codon:yes stop_codon:yes gene_type:complete
MIVLWTKHLRDSSEYTDHWIFFDSLEEAQKYYDYLIGLDTTWTASICSVIESTDYKQNINIERSRKNAKLDK